ncbi:Protein NRT1/ PTR family 5.16 [Vitis vinifera]|uniref:Protein NRT1/ PTR family 5.16 n=1 Tax=Vitis vinifera TaxID=29760 RepID=A0A438IGB0_VITVI|nr:Protein NRT1/ PTR family 5.16 [Vitis vinifera]
MLRSLKSPFLEDTIDGAIDHQGYPSKRSSSGGWRSAIFIIGVEVAERFAYCGIGSNLINYLTGPLGQSTAMAAANVNTWGGTTTLLPLLGAFVADSYLGQYRTIVLASLLYILGLSLLTLSAMLPSLIAFQSQNVDYFTSYSPPQLQIRSAKPKAHSSTGGFLVYLLPCLFSCLELELIGLQSKEMGKPICENWKKNAFRQQLGLGLLAVSSVLPSPSPSECQKSDEIGSCSPPQLQVILFFFALYLVAVGQGGHKPCVQAFGADQFDGQDPAEGKAKSSFFNWWYFSMCFGTLITLFVLNYIQDNLNWGLGFGIPCIAMVIALLVFLLGTKTYCLGVNPMETLRQLQDHVATKLFGILHLGVADEVEEARLLVQIAQVPVGDGIERHDEEAELPDSDTTVIDGERRVNEDEKSPFVRIGQVFVAAARNWRTTDSSLNVEEVARGTLPHQGSQQFRFLNKALLAPDGSKDDGKVCSVSDVEEAKAVLRLFPIWATCLAYAIVFAQSSNFFTKQGITIDRSLGSGFVIPAASLQSYITLAIIIFIPIYDRIFVPIARSLTRKPSGITTLQRIGTGIFLSCISMVTVPMSMCWLIPQYILFGVSDVFTMVGLQEFFYDQAPNELRSVGLALYLSIFGVGNFLSSFLISVIDKTTNEDDQGSWFNDNLNQAHLDYFYWPLAGLSAVGLATYLYFAKSYIYNKGKTM